MVIAALAVSMGHRREADRHAVRRARTTAWSPEPRTPRIGWSARGGPREPPGRQSLRFGRGASKAGGGTTLSG